MTDENNNTVRSCTLRRVRNDFLDSLPPKRAKRAADTIGDAWKQHLQYVANTGQERHFEEYRSTHPDYRTLVYEPENTDTYPLRNEERDKWVFFCSPVRRPTLRYPIAAGPEVDNATVQGRFKKVQVFDKRYIALGPVEARPFVHRDERRLDPLRGIASLVFSTVINKALIIARNAGTDLFAYLGKGGQLPLAVFQPLVLDLDQLHALPERGGAFLGDLKLENTCIRLPLGKPLPPGPLPPARLVDFEDDVVFGDELPQLTPAHAHGTRECITDGLVHGIFQGPGANRAAMASARGHYAMVLMMLAATAHPGSALRRIALCEHRRLPVPDRYPGVMHAENAHAFEPWIEQHVVPEHADNVRELLKNPARFALTCPKDFALGAVFGFTRPMAS
ncbi:hypothetical protein NSY55_26485 [Pseudomonas aeruginosa]|nr:hypothetical protein [Pseudomonas aeruginosa]